MSFSWRHSFILILSGILVAEPVLASLSEANVWEERRQAVTSTRPTSSSDLLASLPVSLAQPGPAFPSATLPSSWSSNKKSQFRVSSVQLKGLIDAVPLGFGSIQEVYDSKVLNGPAVLLLQDIHLNSEAQTNLASVLQELVDQKKIGMIGIEGAFAPFDFTRFRSVADKKLAKQVADDFLSRNKIAAHTYVGLTSEGEPPVMVGVDDPPHYEANVEAYLDAVDMREKVSQELKVSRDLLNKRKIDVFSAELKTFDDLRGGYHAGTIGFGDYVKRLSLIGNFGDDKSIAVEQFLAALEMESKLDFSRVESERRLVLEKISQNLSEKELSNLLAQSLAYKMGRLGFGDYYQNLKSLCEAHGLPLRRYPNFDSYVRYVLLADGIKTETLFKDIDALESAIEQTLAKTPEQKDLLAQSEHLDLTDKLIKFELTPADWEKYKGIVDLRAKIEDSSIKYSSNDHRSTIFELRSSSLNSFEQFYTEADIRSGKMVGNLLMQAPNSKSQITEKVEFGARNLEFSKPKVLITGGYHTPEIAQLLKAQKISYVVVSPKLTKVDGKSGSAYLSVFAREKTPIEKLFAGHKLFLSPVGSQTPDGKPNVLIPELAEINRQLEESARTENAMALAFGLDAFSFPSSWKNKFLQFGLLLSLAKMLSGEPAIAQDVAHTPTPGIELPTTNLASGVTREFKSFAEALGSTQFTLPVDLHRLSGKILSESTNGQPIVYKINHEGFLFKATVTNGVVIYFVGPANQQLNETQAANFIYGISVEAERQRQRSRPVPIERKIYSDANYIWVELQAAWFDFRINLRSGKTNPNAAPLLLRLMGNDLLSAVVFIFFLGLGIPLIFKLVASLHRLKKSKTVEPRSRPVVTPEQRSRYESYMKQPSGWSVLNETIPAASRIRNRFLTSVRQKIDFRELPVGTLVRWSIDSIGPMYEYTVRIEENKKVSVWLKSSGPHAGRIGLRGELRNIALLYDLWQDPSTVQPVLLAHEPISMPYFGEFGPPAMKGDTFFGPAKDFAVTRPVPIFFSAAVTRLQRVFQRRGERVGRVPVSPKSLSQKVPSVKTPAVPRVENARESRLPGEIHSIVDWLANLNVSRLKSPEFISAVKQGKPVLGQKEYISINLVITEQGEISGFGNIEAVRLEKKIPNEITLFNFPLRVKTDPSAAGKRLVFETLNFPDTTLAQSVLGQTVTRGNVDPEIKQLLLSQVMPSPETWEGLHQKIRNEVQYFYSQYEYLPEKKMPAAFRDFVEKRAPTHSKQLTWLESMRYAWKDGMSALRHRNVFGVARALLQAVLQVQPPYADPVMDQQGKLREIKYFPRAKNYLSGTAGAIILFAWGFHFLGWGFSLSAGIVLALILYLVSFFIHADGHELTHAYQFALIERIRSELNLSESYGEIISRIDPSEFQKPVHRRPMIGRSPPDEQRLLSIVDHLFDSVQVAVRQRPAVSAENSQKAEASSNSGINPPQNVTTVGSGVAGGVALSVGILLILKSVALIPTLGLLAAAPVLLGLSLFTALSAALLMGPALRMILPVRFLGKKMSEEEFTLLVKMTGRNPRSDPDVAMMQADSNSNTLLYNPEIFNRLDANTLRALLHFHEAVHFSSFQTSSRFLNEVIAYGFYALLAPFILMNPFKRLNLIYYRAEMINLLAQKIRAAGMYVHLEDFKKDLSDEMIRRHGALAENLVEKVFGGLTPAAFRNLISTLRRGHSLSLDEIADLIEIQSNPRLADKSVGLVDHFIDRLGIGGLINRISHKGGTSALLELLGGEILESEGHAVEQFGGADAVAPGKTRDHDIVLRRKDNKHFIVEVKGRYVETDGEVVNGNLSEPVQQWVVEQQGHMDSLVQKMKEILAYTGVVQPRQTAVIGNPNPHLYLMVRDMSGSSEERALIGSALNEYAEKLKAQLSAAGHSNADIEIKLIREPEPLFDVSARTVRTNDLERGLVTPGESKTPEQKIGRYKEIVTLVEESQRAVRDQFREEKSRLIKKFNQSTSSNDGKEVVERALARNRNEVRAAERDVDHEIARRLGLASTAAKRHFKLDQSFLGLFAATAALMIVGLVLPSAVSKTLGLVAGVIFLGYASLRLFSRRMKSDLLARKIPPNSAASYFTDNKKIQALGAAVEIALLVTASLSGNFKFFLIALVFVIVAHIVGYIWALLNGRAPPFVYAIASHGTLFLGLYAGAYHCLHLHPWLIVFPVLVHIIGDVLIIFRQAKTLLNNELQSKPVEIKLERLVGYEPSVFDWAESLSRREFFPMLALALGALTGKSQEMISTDSPPKSKSRFSPNPRKIHYEDAALEEVTQLLERAFMKFYEKLAQSPAGTNQHDVEVMVNETLNSTLQQIFSPRLFSQIKPLQELNRSKQLTAEEIFRALSVWYREKGKYFVFSNTGEVVNGTYLIVPSLEIADLAGQLNDIVKIKIPQVEKIPELNAVTRVRLRSFLPTAFGGTSSCWTIRINGVKQIYADPELVRSDLRQLWKDSQPYREKSETDLINLLDEAKTDVQFIPAWRALMVQKMFGQSALMKTADDFVESGYLLLLKSLLTHEVAHWEFDSQLVNESADYNQAQVAVKERQAYLRQIAYGGLPYYGLWMVLLLTGDSNVYTPMARDLRKELCDAFVDPANKFPFKNNLTAKTKEENTRSVLRQILTADPTEVDRLAETVLKAPVKNEKGTGAQAVPPRHAIPLILAPGGESVPDPESAALAQLFGDDPQIMRRIEVLLDKEDIPALISIRKQLNDRVRAGQIVFETYNDKNAMRENQNMILNRMAFHLVFLPRAELHDFRLTLRDESVWEGPISGFSSPEPFEYFYYLDQDYHFKAGVGQVETSIDAFAAFFAQRYIKDVMRIDERKNGEHRSPRGDIEKAYANLVAYHSFPNFYVLAFEALHEHLNRPSLTVAQIVRRLDSTRLAFSGAAYQKAEIWLKAFSDYIDEEWVDGYKQDQIPAIFRAFMRLMTAVDLDKQLPKRDTGKTLVLIDNIVRKLITKHDSPESLIAESKNLLGRIKIKEKNRSQIPPNSAVSYFTDNKKIQALGAAVEIALLVTASLSGNLKFFLIALLFVIVAHIVGYIWALLNGRAPPLVYAIASHGTVFLGLYTGAYHFLHLHPWLIIFPVLLHIIGDVLIIFRQTKTLLNNELQSKPVEIKLEGLGGYKSSVFDWTQSLSRRGFFPMLALALGVLTGKSQDTVSVDSQATPRVPARPSSQTKAVLEGVTKILEEANRRYYDYLTSAARSKAKVDELAALKTFWIPALSKIFTTYGAQIPTFAPLLEMARQSKSIQFFDQMSALEEWYRGQGRFFFYNIQAVTLEGIDFPQVLGVYIGEMEDLPAGSIAEVPETKIKVEVVGIRRWNVLPADAESKDNETAASTLTRPQHRVIILEIGAAENRLRKFQKDFLPFKGMSLTDIKNKIRDSKDPSERFHLFRAAMLKKQFGDDLLKSEAEVFKLYLAKILHDSCIHEIWHQHMFETKFISSKLPQRIFVAFHELEAELTTIIYSDLKYDALYNFFTWSGGKEGEPHQMAGSVGVDESVRQLKTNKNLYPELSYDESHISNGEAAELFYVFQSFDLTLDHIVQLMKSVRQAFRERTHNYTITLSEENTPSNRKIPPNSISSYLTDNKPKQFLGMAFEVAAIVASMLVAPDISYVVIALIYSGHFVARWAGKKYWGRAPPDLWKSIAGHTPQFAINLFANYLLIHPSSFTPFVFGLALFSYVVGDVFIILRLGWFARIGEISQVALLPLHPFYYPDPEATATMAINGHRINFERVESGDKLFLRIRNLETRRLRVSDSSEIRTLNQNDYFDLALQRGGKNLAALASVVKDDNKFLIGCFYTENDRFFLKYERGVGVEEIESKGSQKSSGSAGEPPEGGTVAFVLAYGIDFIRGQKIPGMIPTIWKNIGVAFVTAAIVVTFSLLPGLDAWASASVALETSFPVHQGVNKLLNPSPVKNVEKNLAATLDRNQNNKEILLADLVQIFDNPAQSLELGKDTSPTVPLSEDGITGIVEGFNLRLKSMEDRGEITPHESQQLAGSLALALSVVFSKKEYEGMIVKLDEFGSRTNFVRPTDAIVIPSTIEEALTEARSFIAEGKLNPNVRLVFFSREVSQLEVQLKKEFPKQFASMVIRPWASQSRPAAHVTSILNGLNGLSRRGRPVGPHPYTWFLISGKIDLPRGFFDLNLGNPGDAELYGNSFSVSLILESLMTTEIPRDLLPDWDRLRRDLIAA